ncbi:motility protein A [Metabacillus fastidiosus]|uniref:motility protein A n=1 Tax=Metabacillus fastidiosus TaxID=1458 RepID=UPI002DC050B5|nr:MotA/TolQ/ExbB proton channel family protein [Metabacillus fastidiosus]MEC2075202.1 MotA/TolQ/ExbB proton channel family protein [Metabacillus fastidiosus]
MKRQDLLTPFGIILGFILIYISIYFVGGKDALLAFISVSSFVIVVGGVFCSLLVGFGGKEIGKAIAVVSHVFRRPELNLKELVDTLIELSRKSRENNERGLLILEDEAEHISDPFIKKGINLVLSPLSSEMVESIMATEIDALRRHHEQGYRVFYKAGEMAPAWGMVGTIIGLIIMLQNIQNPAEIGPAIAVALVTTFYGVLLAYLVFTPIANKLYRLSEEEIFKREIIIKALLNIKENQNTFIIKEQLESILSPQLGERLKQEAHHEIG